MSDSETEWKEVLVKLRAWVLEVVCPSAAGAGLPFEIVDWRGGSEGGKEAAEARVGVLTADPDDARRGGSLGGPEEPCDESDDEVEVTLAASDVGGRF